MPQRDGSGDPDNISEEGLEREEGESEELDPESEEAVSRLEEPLINMEVSSDLANCIARLASFGLTVSEPEGNVIRIESVVDHHTLDNVSALTHIYNAATLTYDPDEGLTIRFGHMS